MVWRWVQCDGVEMDTVGWCRVGCNGDKRNLVGVHVLGSREYFINTCSFLVQADMYLCMHNGITNVALSIFTVVLRRLVLVITEG